MEEQEKKADVPKDVVESIAEESAARKEALDRESELRLAVFKDAVEEREEGGPSYLQRFFYLLLTKLPVPEVSALLANASVRPDGKVFYDDITLSTAEDLSFLFDELESQYEGWDETSE